MAADVNPPLNHSIFVAHSKRTASNPNPAQSYLLQVQKFSLSARCNKAHYHDYNLHHDHHQFWPGFEIEL